MGGEGQVYRRGYAPALDGGSTRWRRRCAHSEGAHGRSLEDVAAAIGNYQPHRDRPRNLDGLAKNVRLWPDGRYRWHWDPQFMARKRVLADRIPRQEAAARNVKCPSLLVRGGLSDVLSEEGAQAYLDLVPHSKYTNVGQAAHMVAGDRNDIFVSSVLDFLSELD